MLASRAAALVAGAVMAGSLFAVAPAVAGPVSPAAWRDCPTSRFCLWTGVSGTERIVMLQVGDPDLGDPGPRPVFRSAYNRTTAPWCLYRSTYYRDLITVVKPDGLVNLPPDARVASAQPCP
ncbi:peptidase inhibitor family I36 protein [Lentzea flaviverrucosa]|uniref:Peptidase inhibitor family I36 n=1 Tax=Lentzea flaviverrucosa TaxID=200379 RepID=A0A1H9CHJ6_9PSEU|nr:peptidase inhibitor family I36 protein [Lentzea flaviverrucosa]RDI24538.1 peptidase inhibitor family I36 [Lentzea flaviverrucosa]SEQ00098.1 Peptidase inhibitor family I36 [Lentzea flaviverrucosa]